MLKLLFITAAFFTSGSLFYSGKPVIADVAKKDTGIQNRSIYDFKVVSLNGGTIDLADFKGKKILIVNTASKCGFTPQYKGLEELYEKYKDRLVIIGFPANNFFSQEPGSNETISEFCKKNYGVSFPMAAKISVKGKNIAPIYQWLCIKKRMA